MSGKLQLSCILSPSFVEVAEELHKEANRIFTLILKVSKITYKYGAAREIERIGSTTFRLPKYQAQSLESSIHGSLTCLYFREVSKEHTYSLIHYQVSCLLLDDTKTYVDNGSYDFDEDERELAKKMYNALLAKCVKEEANH